MWLLLEIVRWLIAVPAGLIFALCVLLNWGVLLAVIDKRREEGTSFMPLIGPLAGLVFFLFVPIPGAARYWWVALVADPLSVIVLVYFLGLNLKNHGRSPDD